MCEADARTTLGTVSNPQQVTVQSGLDPMTLTLDSDTRELYID